jgi:hypothetical protein
MLFMPFITSMVIAGTPTYSANRIAYDSHSLIVDGQPVYIYSGAFHYFRCPKELWRDRFQKIKDAGLNTVETYVAWNWHEKTKPASLTDYSKMDLTDLKDWLKMAHEEFGLYTIVRPGPYICAEWVCGGYPRWFVAMRPKSAPYGRWLRGDEASYLAWSKHWYDAVCKVVAPEQVTKKQPGKKGVILFQIENEYDYWGGATDEQRKNHLKALYDDSRKAGIDVPIMGCWTRELRHRTVPGLQGVFDSSNLYSRHDIEGAGNSIDSLKREQSDAPGMVSELQGGWFAQVRGRLSEDQEGIGPDQIRAITLECMARGATILNYYMFFGGTHFGDWGARDLTTTYDYNAPIREWGAVGAKYAEVSAIGHMLNQYGVAIAVSERVDKKVDGAAPDTHFIVRQGPSGERFVFMRNASETAPRKGVATITLNGGDTISVAYDLPVFGTDVALTPAGKSEPKDAKGICVTPATPKRPQTPPAIRISKVWTRLDSNAKTWLNREADQSITAALHQDQETALVLYRDSVSLTKEDLIKVDTLAVDMYSDDVCVPMINGNLVDGADRHGRRVTFNVRAALKEGENEIVLLHEDRGNPNGNAGMEDANGVVRAFLTTYAEDVPVTDWRVKLIPESESVSMASDTVDDSTWSHLVLDSKTVSALERHDPANVPPSVWAAATLLNGKRAGAMYRTKIKVSQDQLDSGLTSLVFDRIDDIGTIYVNGQKIGRHEQWDVPYVVDAKSALKVGENVVAVYVVNNEAEGGLTRGVRLSHAASSGMPLAFSQIGRLQGHEEAWQNLASAGPEWATSNLDVATPIARKDGEAPSAIRESLATWTRAEFSLPANEKGVWIPWRLLVRASGNGEMFLNGHSIGRYWEVGPQREFFLPECWLNFGREKRNVLAFCLRATEKGAKVEALEVSPYPDSAEFRK